MKNDQIEQQHYRPESNEVLEAHFNLLREQGIIGKGVTFEDFGANPDYSRGVFELGDFKEGFGVRDNDKVVPFDDLIKLQEFVSLAREEEVIGSAIFPRDLMDSVNFFVGVYAELEKRGVDLAGFGPKPNSASLDSPHG